MNAVDLLLEYCGLAMAAIDSNDSAKPFKTPAFLFMIIVLVTSSPRVCIYLSHSNEESELHLIPTLVRVVSSRTLVRRILSLSSNLRSTNVLMNWKAALPSWCYAQCICVHLHHCHCLDHHYHCLNFQRIQGEYSLLEQLFLKLLSRQRTKCVKNIERSFKRFKSGRKIQPRDI